MNPALEKYALAVSPLSMESRAAFFGSFKRWDVPKEHFLVREEQVCNYLFFVVKGAVRIFYYKNEKRNRRDWIALGEEFLLSIKSFFLRTPSHLLIQTLEATEIYGIHYEDLTKLALAHHDIETWFRKLLFGGPYPFPAPHGFHPIRPPAVRPIAETSPQYHQKGAPYLYRLLPRHHP